MMAKYFAWSVINSDKFRILPDPEGRPNVVRVLADRDYGSSGGRLTQKYEGNDSDGSQDRFGG